MGARSTHNRYRTEPYGRDLNDVIKRAKAFFRADGKFLIIKYKSTYTATTASFYQYYTYPEGTMIFEKQGRRWVQK